MRRYIILLSLFIALIVQGFANQTITLSDSATVSLLTCTPGNQTYSKYGHSAVRVFDPVNSIDWTFNYGVFNFNSKDFYLKFTKGETWYQLDVENTDWFIYASSLIGRITYEQCLNLKPEEKQAIFDALVENYQPQNRYYLYNFVFDNCATRPYNIFKSIIPDWQKTAQQTALTFNGSDTPPTYRQLIRHYSEKNSWPGFGIDFIFGSDADRQVTNEQRLFLPEQLMNLVSIGTYPDGTPLCTSDNTQPFQINNRPWKTSPYMLLLLVIMIMAVITLIDQKRNKISWWLDVTLWLIGALLGMICFYLTFFSIHPLVEHNWNILFINPLLIVPAILIFIPKTRQWMNNNIGIIGLCWFLFMLLRVCGICLQSWHWLMIIPIIHSLRMTVLGRSNLNNIRRKTSRKISPTAKRTTAIITALLCIALAAAEPRLTVVVCIDGMNQHALAQMRGYWQQGGLRTLDEEAHESTIHFPHLVSGGNETLATIVTGTTPDTHGITADRYFSRQDRKVHNILEDAEQKGIGTDLHLSPQALLASTITDEFRMMHSDRSKIYAVGINPETTILLAGHAANACAWLEDKELCWATTGYYSEGLPSAADAVNMKGRIADLCAQTWTPKMDINTYMHPTDKEKKQKGFSYLQKDILRQSPAANTLVIELALDLQNKAQLGTNNHADMLLLQLTVNSPKATSDLLLSAEQEDMYIRLNQDLGWMMEQLDKRIGKNHYRLVIFGKPVYGEGQDALKRANLQTGYFNTERAAALCNTYLMAMYGHERWIDGGYGNSLYLNRTLIEQKKMRIGDIQRQVSSFLLEFEGTKSAFPSTDLPLLPNGGEEEKLRLSLNKRTAGDVLFCLQPLWVIGESQSKTTDRVSESDPVAPLLIWTTELGIETEKEMSATQIKQIILK